jgi:hypothetical protein
MHFVIPGFAIDRCHSQIVVPQRYQPAILKLKVPGLAQEQARGQFWRGTNSEGGSILWEFPKCGTLNHDKTKGTHLWQKNLVTFSAI